MFSYLSSSNEQNMGPSKLDTPSQPNPTHSATCKAQEKIKHQLSIHTPWSVAIALSLAHQEKAWAMSLDKNIKRITLEGAGNMFLLRGQSAAVARITPALLKIAYCFQVMSLDAHQSSQLRTEKEPFATNPQLSFLTSIFLCLLLDANQNEPPCSWPLQHQHQGRWHPPPGLKLGRVIGLTISTS